MENVLKKRRLRYAPSPTGNLHIGGARTALFNFLFTKHYDGIFIIRSEDTDLERNIVGGDLEQIENLEWMGITSDENCVKGGDFGPYKQTDRIDIYNKYIDILLEKKICYKCWCTSEELELDRERQISKGITSPKYSGKCKKNPDPSDNITPSIRISVPKDRNFTWIDGVRGKISFPGKDIGDWVVRKSNGLPTYNFAAVIDDHLMEISDVLRGEEHISNTPKQIHLYESLGWEIPSFFHLSIIVGKDKKKLSKRDESTLQFINLYKERGYLPEAIFNFLSLLGWSPIGEKEIFDKEELVKIFDEKRLSRAPSYFDINKLLWTNNFYIKKLPKEDLWNFLNPFVVNEQIDDSKKMKIFETFQPQLKEGIEIQELIKLFTSELLSIEQTFKNYAKEHAETLQVFIAEAKKITAWTSPKIKEAIMVSGEKTGTKGRNLMMPIRIATTGKEHGPDISLVLKIFGKRRTIQRMEKFINEN